MRLLKFMFLFASLLVFMCCRQKAGTSDGKPAQLEPEAFFAMFHPLSLPASFADSLLSKKHTDSLLTAVALNQFVPDSLIQKQFGKSGKPRFYASGKLVVKNAETYLFVKALSPAKKVLFIICFDKDGKFTAGMPLLIRDEESETRFAATVDNKYTISVSRLRKDGDGRNFFVRSVYVYNAEGVFTLIMTESNEGKPRVAQIYNPIDTLSHKHKFTGDYILDKKNFISFRDGKNNSVIRFFIHFEKDNGNCTGELKGEAHFVNASVARYIANGDPCSLEFNFSEKTVRLKELEGCGNHRGIKCYFDGSYPKRKEVSAKPAKPKRTHK